MWENAYLSIKNPKASRALKRALDPGRKLLTSLAQLHFTMSATFGLRTWGPPLTKSWIHTCAAYMIEIWFLGGLSLHLNHLIASRMTIYDWPFGTLLFRLFGSNLDTRDLETYPRTYSGHFWNMSIFNNSRAIWVLFRKWVVWESQSFLDEGAIVTPLSV